MIIWRYGRVLAPDVRVGSSGNLKLLWANWSPSRWRAQPVKHGVAIALSYYSIVARVKIYMAGYICLPGCYTRYCQHGAKASVRLRCVLGAAAVVGLRACHWPAGPWWTLFCVACAAAAPLAAALGTSASASQCSVYSYSSTTVVAILRYSANGYPLRAQELLSMPSSAPHLHLVPIPLHFLSTLHASPPSSLNRVRAFSPSPPCTCIRSTPLCRPSRSVHSLLLAAYCHLPFSYLFRHASPLPCPTHPSQEQPLPNPFSTTAPLLSHLRWSRLPLPTSHSRVITLLLRAI